MWNNDILKTHKKASLNCAGIASTLEVHTFVFMIPSAKDGM
jgi:hypothetical protein